MIRPLKFPKVAPTTTFENPEVAKRPLGVDYKGLFGLVMMQILDTHRTDGDIAMRKLVAQWDSYIEYIKVVFSNDKL